MATSSTATSPSPNSRAPTRRRAPLDLVVLGNPGSRRLALLDVALRRCGVPPARVVPYVDYLQRRIRLADAISDGCVLRIESPGQDFDVERAILAEGAGLGLEKAGSHLDPGEIGRLAFDRGRLHCPRQWYLGFSQLISRIEQDRASSPAHAVMNDGSSIAELFDKGRCHARLTAEGIPCPRSLAPVRSYDELRSRMAESGVGRVFVKLTCGSSGAGVVALETSGSRTQAFTTAEMVETRNALALYNSRRIRRMSDERSIGRLVDALAAEGVHVEQWVPKAGLEGQTFDVRVVVIGGHPGHSVVRLSRSPITNLHLKNRRGRVEDLRTRMGDGPWQSLLETCRRTAHAFPGCHYVGVDVAVLPGYRRHSVLEVNAFGDLLPDVVDESGRDTYTAEVESLVLPREDRIS